MPVKFFAHTPVDDLNERGALFEVARQLLERYAGEDAPRFTLVANIVPDRVPAWREHRLPQLDAVLLGERFVTLLEFKTVAQPLIGGEDTRWKIVKRDGRHDHDALAGNSPNPYLQMKHARHQWSVYFKQEAPPAGKPSPYNWNELSGRLVFYPALHPESQLFDPPIWLRYLSAREVAADAAINTADFRLTPDLMDTLAAETLQASVWNLATSIRHVLGVLAVHRPNRSLDTYPIYAHSQMTIGRYSSSDVPIDPSFSRTSRRHARIVADDQGIRLYDEGSRHGIFVDGRRVWPKTGQLLRPGVHIELGHAETEEQQQQVATMFLQPPPLSHAPTSGLTTF